MNKKILLGSIIAVVILVLVSFTGVVGYQTTKSSTIAKASPLFSVRSKRAIDEENKGIACDYVGKGEESKIQIPPRNNLTIQIHDTINKIRMLDDKEFKAFLTYIKIHLAQEYKHKEEDINRLITELNQLRDDTDGDINYFLDSERKYQPTHDCDTIYLFLPRCFIQFILLFLYIKILSLISYKDWCTVTCGILG
ncbi:hypothetical protein ES703_44510 [subsurface metagenome]